MIPTAIRLVLGILCLTTASQAAAAQTYEVYPVFSPYAADIIRQTRVPYSDLDLYTPQGAQTLLSRIEAAADAVCETTGFKVRISRAQYNQCRKGAIAGAVRTLRRPLLTVAFVASRGEAMAAPRGPSPGAP